MPVVMLNGDIWFPPQHMATSDGLLAVGGDLTPERLVLAYQNGIFPWYEEGAPILWWCPDPRFVLFPDELKLRRSLRKTLRQNKFEVRCDTRFAEVMAACAAAPRQGQNGTWITQAMLDAYTQLFEMGLAHSVETYLDGVLVGGLYGIAMGPFFFGESMFHRASNASKVALAALVHRYQQGVFIDCQVENEFFTSMGARHIPRDEFLTALRGHLGEKNLWHQPWKPATTAVFVPAAPGMGTK